MALIKGTGVNIVIRAIDNFSKTFMLAQTQVKGLTGFINKHRAGFLLAGAAITGVTALIASSSIKAFATFEEQMINSLNMFDNVTVQMRKDAEELARSLSKELGVSAVDTAEALFFFGSAGMNMIETMEAMPRVLKFAKVNVLGMAEASDFALTIMKVWGVEGTELTKTLDTVTFAMKNAKLNMNQMGESFKFVAPIAADLGITVGEAAILTGTLADAGIAGSMAGTVLRQSILKLTAPTGKAASLIKELGIRVFDSDGKFKGILPVLEQFEKVTETMTEKQRIMALKVIFGTRQVSGMSAILKKGAGSLKTMAKEADKATGIMDNMFEKIEKGTKFTLDQLNAEWNDMKISLGQALIPVLKDLIDIIKPMINWFAGLSDESKRFIVIGGMITGVVLLLAPAIAALIPIFSALIPLVLTLTGPVGLAALAAGFIGVVGVSLLGHTKAVDNLSNSYSILGKEANLGGGELADLFDDDAIWIEGLDKINNMIDGFKRLEGVARKETIQGYVPPELKDKFTFTMPNLTKVTTSIPQFQTGGIMPHTGMAMLHKGEKIIPANQAGGTTIIIEGNNIYGTDPDEMAEALQDKLDTMIST